MQPRFKCIEGYEAFDVRDGENTNAVRAVQRAGGDSDGFCAARSRSEVDAVDEHCLIALSKALEGNASYHAIVTFCNIAPIPTSVVPSRAQCHDKGDAMH